MGLGFGVVYLDMYMWWTNQHLEFIYSRLYVGEVFFAVAMHFFFSLLLCSIKGLNSVLSNNLHVSFLCEEEVCQWWLDYITVQTTYHFVNKTVYKKLQTATVYRRGLMLDCIIHCIL